MNSSPSIQDLFAQIESAELSDPTTRLAAAKQITEAIHASVVQRFEAGAHASQLVRDHAQLIDALLIKLWQLHFPHNNADIALIAVGGYGRQELHPKSDIDLLILLRNNDHETYHQALSEFITLLWDLKMDVGHSVRSVDECIVEAKKDITVATNLMEARLLTGADDLFNTIQETTSAEHIWRGPQFFEAKWQEQIERHQKFHDAVYNLEPNVKEGPGGLRDIQMIGWVAKRHFGASTLHDLVHHHFLTEDEYINLMEGQEFLWRVRLGLHIITKRKEERLLFDYQKSLAKLFGYEDNDHRLAVEQFMKDYYTNITELNRLNEMLLQLFQEEILLKGQASELKELNNRFHIRHGFISVKHDTTFKRYPFALLEIFLLLQQTPDVHGVTAETIRLMRNHRHLIDDKFRQDWRNRTLFLEILRQPAGITQQLRRMNRYGILAEYIPAFGNIVGLMQYDLFHAYTVDEHTLMVLRNLRRFTVPAFQHEVPICSKVIAKIPKLELLYLAGLFHDIAKGRGGDHSKLGAVDALDFCLEHGLSQYDAKLVSWIVENHLLFSATAQRQDITDPDVINAFAEQVGDQIHLNYLFLMTVADVRGTNPEIWNSWKATLFSELYIQTTRALRRGQENPVDKVERIEEVQASAKSLLKQQAVSDNTTADIWQHFNEDYFLRHSAEEICWHTREISIANDLPLVAIRYDASKETSSIFIYAQDQDYLFATITKLLDDMNLNVLDARIITTQESLILDTFVVSDANGAPISDTHTIETITEKLKAGIAQANQVCTPSKRRMPRRLKHFNLKTDITFTTDILNNRTIMELIAADRPGFLAYVGKALVSCDVRLQNAKISTLGERVEDVFFLTDHENQPITDAQTFDCLKKNLKKSLDGDRE